MPRLTNQLYLARHRDLKWIDQKIPKLFEVLTPGQFWDLHEFYRFTSDLSDAELLEHRRTITEEHPSLPSRTSKSYLRIYHCHVYAVQKAKGNTDVYYQVLARFSRQPKITFETDSRAGAIQASARFRAEPDWDRLTRALLMFLDRGGDSGRD